MPPGHDQSTSCARPPEIVTERLILDRLRAPDADAFFAYRSRPDVYRYQAFAPSALAEAAGFIGALESVAWDTPDTWSQLAVREHGTRRLIGDLGVHFLDEVQVEIGFTLDPAHQGSGLATEAVTALLDHLFLAMGKHRVTASVDPRNGASVRLLRRIGMRREAHYRRSLCFKGEWADDLVFALLASEWPRETI